MKTTEINQKLRRSFDRATPDMPDSILHDCQNQKGETLVIPEKKFNYWKFALAAAACLVLLLGIFGGSYYNSNLRVASTISLDVNPSIQITVNQKERVIQVLPLNEDGKIVVGDMDFSGCSLDVTVNSLIGSMLRNGYLSELANSILISVDSNDPEAAAALCGRLSQEVDGMLSTDNFSGAVLSQRIQPDSALQSQAEQYGITTGKAQLIQEILECNQQYTFDALCGLSINELNLLMKSGTSQPENITSTGNASDQAYIGIDAAKQAAFAQAGVTEDAVSDLEVELEAENGVLVYSIEFHAAGHEHDCHIDARTGAVHKAEQESHHRHQNGTGPQPTLSEDEARKIALEHAGITENAAVSWEITLEREDGRAYYDLEFFSGNDSYEYEIDAVTGAILKSEKEPLETPQATTPTQATTPPESTISEAKARSIALNHAGVAESAAKNWDVSLERDDGRAYFDLEFVSGNDAYEYEIDAVTGAILKSEKDTPDVPETTTVTTPTETSPTTAPESTISESEARQIALNHAGATGHGSNWEVSRDEEDGIPVYELDFCADGYEYSYEIDCRTGSILSHDHEVCDDCGSGHHHD